MTCRAGDTAKVVRSTPKLEEHWQEMKDAKKLGRKFGVGSEIMLESVQGAEATVVFKSDSGLDRITLPLLCLSCYTAKPVPSGNVWEGTNKELRPLPEDDAEAGIQADSGIYAPMPPAEAEMPGQRICATCGASVSEVDTMCNVCGAMVQVPGADGLGELEELPPQEERSCPSCGAIVEPDAAECPICETPFEAVGEKPEAARTAVAAAIAPIPVSAKSRKEPAPEPSEPERLCPSCGAVVEPDAAECPICETPFEAVGDVVAEEPARAVLPVPVPLPSEPEPPMPAEPAQLPKEAVCQSCGAVLDEGSEECFICGASLGAEPEPVPAAAPAAAPAVMEEPPEPDIPPEERHMAAPPAKAETVCLGCGAVLDEGSDECFICGTKVGEEPAEIPSSAAAPVPAAAVPAPEPEQPAMPEPAKEIVLGENEILCPSCSSVIPADSEKCPECWNDLSLYMKCPSCGKLTPAGEEACRECFAVIGTGDIDKAIEEELGLEAAPAPAEEVEITEELKVEMTALETEEEQGKECLVCGAIFGPDDLLCPVCGIEYGVEIEEPKAPEIVWDHMDVELLPTVHTCPSCGENVTGLEATEREVKEGSWFYRGLIAIFVGIFFTSFSIYARGVSVENESLGMQVPPTDVVLNLVGWLLVLVGFVFWFMSWRLHSQRLECPNCGIETDPQMQICINCGHQLTEVDEAPEEEGVDEELLPKDESLKDQYSLLTEKPLQYGIPSEEVPPEVQDILPEEALQDAPQAEGTQDFEAEDGIPEKPAARKAPAAQPKAPEAKPEHFEHGEDIPVGHEEHKKCPGCGIFIDIGDAVCPICDTPFTQPEQPEPVKDRDITVPTEEEELASLDTTEPEPSIDSITVPKESADQIECPSCGASLDAGTKSCPVCEYPMG